MQNKLKYLKVVFRIYLRKYVFFLKTKLDLKTFIIIASLVVGVFSGLAAVLLKQVVHFFQQEPNYLFPRYDVNYLFAFTPLIGMLLCAAFVKFFLSGKLQKSLSHVIYLILRKGSNIPAREMFSHIITSGVTVGLGGSAGLESPSVITGAAIGSNIAKELRFNYQTRTLLLACGSAAGISAIFGSPIAGVIFAFEVILPEFTIPSLIPLLIASASASVVSRLLYSGQLFYLVTSGWVVEALPFYILLGILCGIISVYMIRVFLFIEHKTGKINRPFLKAALGGLALCFLIFLFPPLFGEGYSFVVDMLAGNYNSFLSGSVMNFIPDKEFALIVLAIVIILLKVIATSLTLHFGGNGGIIAPSLFTGAVTGFLLAHSANYLNIASLNHSNFIVVGMAGILSGVLHSPLTGIFLIAEVTGGYLLIVPLMIVTALAFFISRYFHPHSIYTETLFKMGVRFRTEKERYFVQQLSVSDLTETDFVILKAGMSLRQVMEKISGTKRNLFPVTDENNKLIGLVTLDDVREYILRTEVHDVVLVYEIMNTHFESIEAGTDINKVLEIFEQKPIWNLPVVKNGVYQGFISKSTIFNKYISVWSKQQAENI